MMICTSRSSALRRLTLFGVLAAVVLLAMPGDVRAQFGSSSAPPVTVTKVPRGPDRGYDFYASSSGANLLSISQLILKLTRELLDLIDSGSHGGGSADGPTLRDFELSRKLAQLRAAVRQRRAMQLAQVMDQAVDEMIRDEQQATRQGRQPTQQQVEQEADKVDEKVAQRRAQIESGFEAGGNPAEAAPPPPTQPPAAEPAAPKEPTPPETAGGSDSRGQPTEEDRQRFKEGLKKYFAMNASKERNGSTADKISRLEDDRDYMIAILRPEFAEQSEPLVRAAFDAAINRLKQQEEDRTLWIDFTREALQVTPAEAEAFENRDQQRWRKEKEKLYETLDLERELVRSAQRRYYQEPTPSRREAYEETRQRRDETLNMLDEHLKTEPK